MSIFSTLSGSVSPARNWSGGVPSHGIPEVGDLESHVMPNPSTPHLLIEIARKDQLITLEIQPETLEWVISTEGADMLKFTVPDPDFILIDNPLLVEDFKTEVRFRYGYNSNMSMIGHMRYFNMRASFPAQGPVMATIVCYDLSVFLSFDVKGSTLEGTGSTKLGVKDIIAANLRDAEAQFDIKLDPEYGGCDFEGQYFRVIRPNGKLIDHFRELAAIVSPKGSDETQLEVFVEDDKLHFHPPRRNLDPIGAFAYAAEHPGARLLSFEPQTDLNYTPPAMETLGINADTGQVEGEVADPKSGAKRPTNAKNRTDGGSGSSKTHTVPRVGDAEEQADVKVVNKKYVATGDEGDNLMGILEQFPGSNLQMFLEANHEVFFNESTEQYDPNNFELTKDQPLTVPIPQNEEKVSTPESGSKAKSEFLAYESRALNATAVVMGDPRLRAGYPVDIFRVGLKYEGRWYVRECSHTFGVEGYRCMMQLTREGINYGDGIVPAVGASPAYEPVPPVDAEDQAGGDSAAPTVTTDAVPGTTTGG